VEASGLSPPNSQSIPPKSSSYLPMKSFFNSLYTITKASKKLKAIRNAVDLAMDLLLPSQATKHRRISLSPIENHEPSPTPRSPVKYLKISPEDCFFAQIYMTQAEWSKTTKLRIFLSVADFASHAKFVVSWPAWVAYGFAIATKGSKPHSHQ